jgi:pimeloyl-ACP methyl ester carboxylesterase
LPIATLTAAGEGSLPPAGPAASVPGPASAQAGAYRPLVADTSRFETIRGLRYHLRAWRTPSAASADVGHRSAPSAVEAPLLLLLHGWMDVSASFQFVVDALAHDWRVVAPDWRGFGLSEGSPAREWAVDSYAFADYLGDLDALLDRLSPEAPVNIVAHSMGGNVAMLYAGIRPHRVAGLVNLEGFGLPETDPTKAVERYRRWLDELKEPARLRPFGSLGQVAARLMKTNPRLAGDKAAFLAGHWARPLETPVPGDAVAIATDAGASGGQADGQAHGGYRLRADPAHRRINPVPYRVDEALSCWAAIAAPVLWVASHDRDSFHEFTRTAEYRRRLAVIPRLREVNVADAGHMLHHDQPGVIAGLIEDFFSR